MKLAQTITLVLAAFSALVAFGYCLAIWGYNTFRPLLQALEAVK